MHPSTWEISDWGVAVTIVSVVGGAVIALWRRKAPQVRAFCRRVDGTLDAIVGREAYVDTASGRRVPALPPLTNRVANVEEAIIRLTRFEERVGSLEHRVTALEDGRVERTVARAESAQMWRAIADHDPDLIPPDLSDDE